MYLRVSDLREFSQFQTSKKACVRVLRGYVRGACALCVSEELTDAANDFKDVDDA